MRFVNRIKLKSRMVETGFTMKTLAEELCLTYNGLWNKVNAQREFTERELYVLNKLFGTSIFFLGEDNPNLGITNHE